MRKRHKFWVFMIVLLIILNIYLYMNVRNNAENQDNPSPEENIRRLERSYLWIIGFIIIVTLIALVFLITKKKHYH